MLILSRKIDESIVVDGRITIKVLRLEGDVVKLGIDAPPDVPVHRQEIYEEIQRNNREAVMKTRSALPKWGPPPPAQAPAVAGNHHPPKTDPTPTHATT